MKLLSFRDRVRDRFYLVRYGGVTIRSVSILWSVFKSLDDPRQERILSYD